MKKIIRIGALGLLGALTAGGLQAAANYRFANFLFQNKDFYRAMVEYQRVYFSATGDDKAFGQLKAAESLYFGKEFSKVPQETKALLAHKPYKQRVDWLHALAYAHQGQFELALLSLENKKTRAALYQGYLFQLKLNNDKAKAPPLPKGLTQVGNKLIRTEIYSGRIDTVQLKQLWLAWPRQHYKSSLTAAIFSVLLPGAGQAYNGNYGDALSSFFIVSLFAGLSTLAFFEQENLLGGVSAAAAMAFYGGGIYGAYHGSAVYNRRLTNDFNKQLESMWLRYEALRF